LCIQTLNSLEPAFKHGARGHCGGEAASALHTPSS
jgi:hypothetical protein